MILKKLKFTGCIPDPFYNRGFSNGLMHNPEFIRGLPFFIRLLHALHLPTTGNPLDGIFKNR